MVSDLYIVTALTIGAVVLNFGAALRAAYIAIYTDTNCDWQCRSDCKNDGVTILLGFAAVCTILGMLKLWSVADVFAHYWDDMPVVYHIRSFAYLGENYGLAILAWKVTSFIKNISECQNIPRGLRTSCGEGQ